MKTRSFLIYVFVLLTSFNAAGQHADSLRAVAIDLYKQAKFQEAIPVFRSEVQARRFELSDSLMLFKAHYNLASCFRHTVNLEKAMIEYDNAEIIIRKLLAQDNQRAFRKRLVHVLHYKGDVYGQLGQNQLATGLFNNAIELAKSDKDYRKICNIYNSSTGIYISQKQPKKLYPLLQEQKEYLSYLPKVDQYYGNWFINTGAYHEFIGQYDSAEISYNEALRIFNLVNKPSPSAIAITNNNLAIVKYEKGDLPGAIELIDKALHINRETDRSDDLAENYLQKAKFTSAQGNYIKALSLLDSANSLISPDYRVIGSTEFPSPHAVISAPMEWLKLANQRISVLNKMGLETKNTAQVDKAILGVDSVNVFMIKLRKERLTKRSQEVISAQFRPVLASGLTTILGLMNTVKQDSNKVKSLAIKAFEFMELGKSILLLTDFRGKQNADADRPFVKKQYTLKLQLNQIVQQQPFDADLYDHVSEKLKQLKDSIKSMYPEYYLELYKDVTTFETVSKALVANNQDLLSYFQWRNQLFRIHITSDGEIEFAEVMEAKSLEENLATMRRLIINSKNNWNKKSSEKDKEELSIISTSSASALMPNNVISISRLVIIPDGNLFKLPFGALKLSNGNYLGKQVGLTHDFSATLWMESQQHLLERKERRLVFAPKFTANGKLPPLFFNRKMADLFKSSIFDASSSKMLKHDFEETLRSHGIIMLATHGRYQLATPDSSCIYLAEPSNEQSKINDILYVTDIEQMSLKNQLVVLASCQTADGEILEGEGVKSIHQAFRRAGVENVLAPLWEVSEQPTLTLMSDFVNEFDQGLQIDMALKRANSMSELSPYYWAGFVNYGSARNDDSQYTNKSYYWIGIAFLIITLALLLFYFRSKRQRSQRVV